MWKFVPKTSILSTLMFDVPNYFQQLICELPLCCYIFIVQKVVWNSTEQTMMVITRCLQVNRQIFAHSLEKHTTTSFQTNIKIFRVMRKTILPEPGLVLSSLFCCCRFNGENFHNICKWYKKPETMSLGEKQGCWRWNDELTLNYQHQLHHTWKDMKQTGAELAGTKERVNTLSNFPQENFSQNLNF